MNLNKAIDTIVVLTVFSVILTGLRVSFWPFEIFTAFAVQATSILLLAAMLFAFTRRWMRSIVATVFAILGIALLFPFAANETIPLTPPAGHYDVRIGHVNLLSHGKGIPAVNRWAASERIDILEVTELPSSQDFQIAAAFPNYPYSIMGDQKGRRKIAILSKHPLKELEVDNDLVTAGVVTIDGAAELTVVATHPSTGAFPIHLRKRDDAIKAAFAEAANSSFAVVIGDFNAAPWSPILHETSKKYEFERMRGGVFNSTWITPLPILGLAIDHIYVSEDVGVWVNGRGPFIGSDHWPIFTTILIPAQD